MQRTTHAVLSLLVASALAGGLTACGSDDGSAGAGAGASATSPAGGSASGGAGDAAGGASAGGSGEGSATPKTAPKPKNTADEAFARQLLPRDAQVVVVSTQTLKRTKQPNIKDIAGTVRKAQLAEARDLREIAAKEGLSLDGADERAKADAKLLHTTTKKLGAGGTSAAAAQGTDEAFLDLLIAHHEAWLVLSRAERKYGEIDALQQLARARVKEIRQELALLKVLRQQG